jgi:hypothetical protein
MPSTLLILRLVHLAFVLAWFQFLFLLHFLHPPEHPVPVAYPIVLAAVAISSISVCERLRKQLVHEPAVTLETQPENQAVWNRWRAGNILSFAFAESTMLFGVLLKFLGESWKVVGMFFAVGLVLLLVWTPRAVKVWR